MGLAASAPDEREDLDFDSLYRGNVDALWRMARALGVPSAHVEDAVQEVFVIAMRRADSFEGRSTVRRWLIGILVKVAAKYRRKLARENEQLPETLVDEGQTPAQRAEQRQARDLLLEVLDHLEEKQRTVWVLTEAEKLSARAIGELLGVSPNTVSSRLRLARKQIDRQLARIRAQNRWRLR